MKQLFLSLLFLLAFLSVLFAAKIKSKSTGTHWQFSSSKIFALDDSSGDAKKFEEQWNKRRSRLAQCKHRKNIKCPSVMARVKTDAQTRELAKKALQDKRGQNIFIIRYKSQKKAGLEMAKSVLSTYFALIVKKGIICRAKRCDTKRYRHQYLPFQLAYAYNSLGDCAFEYGETVKGKSKRKGGFGIRMLCLSKNTMSEELYTVGKSCSACKKKCDSDGLCDGDSISSPKSAKTSSKTKSKSKSKPKKGPSTGNSPLASMKDSSSMQVEDKLGDLCEVSDIKGEAVGQDGDKIAEYINKLRASVTMGNVSFSGHLLKPIDMFKVTWKDSLGTSAHKLLDMKDYKGTHVPVITFAVKDSDEKMEVLQTALELYFNKFKNHINCVKDHCYNAKADILFELIKADVKYIGCQVRYSKTGGISPKMNVKAVVYCETDPPVNVSTSTTKQEIELYKQHENSCAESDATKRNKCSDGL